MEVRADHWVGAWKAALSELGETDIDPASISCRIGDDGAVEVTAGSEGRRLFVRSKGPGETLETESAEVEGAEVEGAEVEGVPSLTVPTDMRLASTTSSRNDRHLETRLAETAVSAMLEDLPAPAPRARIKRNRSPTGRRKPQTGSHVGSRVPYAPAFDGGVTTTTREALDMLGQHVRAEATQYLVPTEDAAGWRVESARGSMTRQVTGATLRSTEAVLGSKEGGSGRRTFAGEGVKIRFARGLGRKVAFNVKSALWAPIQGEFETVGLLLLLNARREGGFTDSDLSAVNELARLLARRNSG